MNIKAVLFLLSGESGAYHNQAAKLLCVQGGLSSSEVNLGLEGAQEESLEGVGLVEAHLGKENIARVELLEGEVVFDGGAVFF